MKESIKTFGARSEGLNPTLAIVRGLLSKPVVEQGGKKSGRSPHMLTASPVDTFQQQQKNANKK